MLLPEEEAICSECLSSLTKTTHVQADKEYERKFSSSKIIDEFHPLYIFEKGEIIQNLLHSLKYNNAFFVGKFFGKQIAKEFAGDFKIFNPDMIIPVPLHRLKKAERGYNQSYWIAKGVASELRIEIAHKTVKRRKYTESQTAFDKAERSRNISGAFRVAKPNSVKGKRIIIVDDVVTTGATASELAAALKNAGADKILLASVAVPLL